MQLHFVTVVWGQRYTEQFLNFCLPTLLSIGNFPALTREGACRYLIFTRAADAETMERHPALQRLRSLVDVELRVLADSEFVDEPRHSVHHRLWERSAAEVAQCGGYLVFIPPDTFWADGALASMARMVANGRRLIYQSVMRVIETTFVEEIRARAGFVEGGPLAVPPAELVGLLLRHLHPISSGYLPGSPNRMFHHEHGVWAIPGEGLLVRTLVAHPTLVDPTWDLDEFHAPRKFEPHDIGCAQGSDEFFCVSITELAADVDWYVGAKNYDLLSIASWWSIYITAPLSILAGQRFEFHTGKRTPELWRAAEEESDRFIELAYQARAVCLVARHLKHNLDLMRAPEALAVALSCDALLYQKFELSGPVTLLIPIDEAFADAKPWMVQALLSAEDGGADLAKLLQNHILCGDHDLLLESQRGTAQRLRTLSGRELAACCRGGQAEVDGALLLREVRVGEGVRAYLIDEILW